MENVVTQGRKVELAIKALAGSKGLSTVAEGGAHVGVLIPTLSYGCERLV